MTNPVRPFVQALIDCLSVGRFDLDDEKACQEHAIIDPALGVQAAQADASKLQGLVDRYLEAA